MNIERIVSSSERGFVERSVDYIESCMNTHHAQTTPTAGCFVLGVSGPNGRVRRERALVVEGIRIKGDDGIIVVLLLLLARGGRMRCVALAGAGRSVGPHPALHEDQPPQLPAPRHWRWRQRHRIRGLAGRAPQSP